MITIEQALQRVEEIQKKGEIESLITSLFLDKLPEIVSSITSEIETKIPALIPDPIKGEKGDKGDRGERGKDGKDAPTLSEIVSAIPKPRDGKDGRDGSPDTPTQVRDKLASLEDDDRLDASAIKNLQQAKHYSAITTGSKAYFKVVAISGTKDGSNREFYLPEAPKYGSQVFVLLNGQVLQQSTHYTIRGVTLTYDSAVTAPKSSWNHFAIIFKP